MEQIVGKLLEIKAFQEIQLTTIGNGDEIDIEAVENESKTNEEVKIIGEYKAYQKS
ncbi:hypothetical protein [Bacillus thuringiensis]|uniref:hypothetical protein n=1 Tax=Bacillus thuringiensis TaxID=1428 RepID=UPI001596F842|nr:hypothetical protein [Bacillus thuringiensis]